MTATSGPVPIGSKFYVTRPFEGELLQSALNRDWVLLVGPRQHGKTSALARLSKQLTGAGFRVAFVDLQTLPPSYGFAALLEWFAKRVATGIGQEVDGAKVLDKESLEAWLTHVVPIQGAPVVIIIDEASAILDPVMRNSFFGQIRAIKNAATFAPNGVAALLQFVFAGTFKQETLVDPANSPFNVCTTIEPNDLTRDDVESLSSLVVADTDKKTCADLIYDIVGGQPYLVQRVLSAAQVAEPGARLDAVTQALADLENAGNDHVGAVFRAILAEPALTKLVASAVATNSIQNDPTSANHKFLVILGLFKKNGPRLEFRCLLYSQIARRSPQLRPETTIQGNSLVPLFPLEPSALSFIRDAEYREICLSAHNGAVAIYNAGHFRLALVGFGIALEAVLIDWMTGKTATDIASAVASASAKKKITFSKFESATDPGTWNLAKLMQVARELNGIRGPLDVNEALREMRNLVHPALMKQKYLSEGDLAPEAVAAAGLLQSVLRDVQSP